MNVNEQMGKIVFSLLTANKRYYPIDMVAGLLTAINCYNVKWATRVQDIFTGTKIFALVIIMVAGFWWLCMGHTENFRHPMDGTNTQPGYVALAVYSGLFSYSGWNYLNYVTEELKDPYR